MIKIVKNSIKLDELKKWAPKSFGNLVKAVVDIEKEAIALFGALHSDEEAALLKTGSKQKDLWGINIYPNKSKNERVEFDSMINLRPSQGNSSRGVDDPKKQKGIIHIVNNIIKE